MLQPTSSHLIPEWYRKYVRFVSKRKRDPQQVSLLFFLSEYYDAQLYYTVCSNKIPLSYVATFEDTVIIFKCTSYPSEGCMICVSINQQSITAMFTVADNRLLYDESFHHIVHDQIVDLSCQGDRWEGDVLDHEPFGWGDLYDADNHHIYRGFISGSDRICFGIEYHQNTCVETMLYCGNWGWNVRSGYGQVFDRNGALLYKGEWLDNQLQVSRELLVSETSPVISLSSLVEDIVIGNHCCNSDSWKQLDLQFAVRLRNLTIGDECFSKCDTVIIAGLKQLKRCVIGTKSFTLSGSTVHENVYRSLCITHCPQLKEILIGNRSFADFYVCDLQCLPSLKSLYIGDESQWSYCFKYCPQLHIRDFPSLEYLHCGGNSFLCVHSVCFENLPKLRSIVCNRCAFQGDIRHCNDGENELIMRNLPSLTLFSLDIDCFCHIDCVTIDQVPNVQHICIGYDSFYYTQTLYIRKSDALKRQLSNRRQYIRNVSLSPLSPLL